MTETMPVLQIRHADGDDWKVAAMWPDGRSEEIKGFKTESAANEWIANSFAAWLEKADRDGTPGADRTAHVGSSDRVRRGGVNPDERGPGAS